MASAAAISKLILDRAKQSGSATWTEIASTASFYAKGYAQSLVDIAKAVKDGDLTIADGKQYAHNATFLLAQGISNMAHILLYQVQSLLNGVIDAVKGQINTLLGVALL